MKLGARSTFHLASCNLHLQNICSVARNNADFVIIEGHVGKREQFKRDIPFPQSPHNQIPSKAIKFLPIPTQNVISVVAMQQCLEAFAEAARKEGVRLRFYMEEGLPTLALTDA